MSKKIIESIDVLNELDLNNLPIDAVHISNLFRNIETYEVNEIYDLTGKKIEKLIDLYGLINDLLRDIIDIVVKSNLSDINDLPQKYSYQVFGGKAFERIMNPLHDNIRTFDFDIELEESIERITEFTRGLTYKINSYVNYEYGPMRRFIKNILFKYNLIDDTCFDHYDKKKYIFFYGTYELTSGKKELGIFIDLLFKKNLFMKGDFYSNINSYPQHNIIYYPICNIKTSIHVNPKIHTGINYAPIPNTLLGFIHAIINNVKLEKNIRRIESLKNKMMYLCNTDFNFPKNDITFNEQKKLDKKLLKEFDYNDIDNNIINLKKYFNNITSGEKLLEKLVDIYYDTYDQYLFDINKNNCNIFLDNHKMDTFMAGIDTEFYLEQIKDILETIDKKYDKSVYEYTGGQYTYINLYCQLKAVGLDERRVIKNYLTDVDKNKKYVINMQNLYNELRKNEEYIKYVDMLFKDEFEVISFQTFLYFNNPLGNISDVTSLMPERGNIIYMPNFLSTSYDVFPGWKTYSTHTKVLYRIKIKNKRGNGKNWLVVDKYGQYLSEREILIETGSYFVIENIEFVPMVGLQQDIFFNMKMINMTLCDNFNDAIEYSKKFGEKHLLYGQFQEGLFTGGKINESIVKTTKPNYIFNTYTIMINPELFDKKYEKLDNFNQIIDVYFKYYPLFQDIVEKYTNKISIIGIESGSHDIKFLKNLNIQKKLPELSVPELYSITPNIQFGGGNNEHFYRKYIKYKLKYLKLKNRY